MQGLRLLFLLRSRLAPKQLRQVGSGEETAFVPQACITARKTLKTSWRDPCTTYVTYKTHPTYKTSPIQSLRGYRRTELKSLLCAHGIEYKPRR